MEKCEAENKTVDSRILSRLSAFNIALLKVKQNHSTIHFLNPQDIQRAGKDLRIEWVRNAGWESLSDSLTAPLRPTEAITCLILSLNQSFVCHLSALKHVSQFFSRFFSFCILQSLNHFTVKCQKATANLSHILIALLSVFLNCYFIYHLSLHWNQHTYVRINIKHILPPLVVLLVVNLNLKFLVWSHFPQYSHSWILWDTKSCTQIELKTITSI